MRLEVITLIISLLSFLLTLNIFITTKIIKKRERRML